MSPQPLPPRRRDLNFVALDFETANYAPDSACSLGLVRVEKGKITDQKSMLIRPPYEDFVFTYIHGLTWADVAEAPDFGQCWPGIENFISGTGFLAAHNCGFDRKVLRSCCERFEIEAPDIPFRCTVQLARKTWRLPSNSLAKVAEHLGIELNHHEALSDAMACARIVLAAAGERAKQGGKP